MSSPVGREIRIDRNETIRIDPEQIFHFPGGLPGFRALQDFVVLEPAGLAPLVYLQSCGEPYTRFILIPAHLVDQEYHLALEPWDAEILLSVNGPGEDQWLVYFVLAIDSAGHATVNMLAPVVLRPANQRGVQAVRSDSRYSYARPLHLERVEVH